MMRGEIKQRKSKKGAKEKGQRRSFPKPKVQEVRRQECEGEVKEKKTKVSGKFRQANSHAKLAPNTKSTRKLTRTSYAVEESPAAVTGKGDLRLWTRYFHRGGLQALHFDIYVCLKDVHSLPGSKLGTVSEIGQSSSSSGSPKTSPVIRDAQGV